MLEAASIGLARSTPGLFSMRRRIRLLRRFNWRWTLAFTRKPPGGEWLRGVKYLTYPRYPGGFRASWPRSDSDYAWLRTRDTLNTSSKPPGSGPTPAHTVDPLNITSCCGAPVSPRDRRGRPPPSPRIGGPHGVATGLSNRATQGAASEGLEQA